MNRVTLSEADPLPNLPESLIEDLVVDLREHVHPDLAEIGRVSPYPPPEVSERDRAAREAAHIREIRMLFLRFFVSMFGTFRTFINHETSSGSFFNQELFLSAQPAECQEFLDQFLDTQAFQIFIEKQVAGDGREFPLFNDMAERVQQGESIDSLFPHTATAQPSSSPRRSRSVSASQPRPSKSDNGLSVRPNRGSQQQLPSISRSRSTSGTLSTSSLSHSSSAAGGSSVSSSSHSPSASSAPALASPPPPSYQELLHQEMEEEAFLDLQSPDPAAACLESMDLHMWSPLQLPGLSDARAGDGPRHEDMLARVKKVIREGGGEDAQLHFLKAQLLTAIYERSDHGSNSGPEDERTDDERDSDSHTDNGDGHEGMGGGGSEILLEALITYSKAFSLDALRFDPRVAQPLLERLSGKQLKRLAEEELFEGLRSLTKERIYSRELALNPTVKSSNEATDADDSDEGDGDDGRDSKGDRDSGSLRRSHDWLSRDPTAISVPSKGLSAAAFQQFALEYHLVSSKEDAARLSEALLRASRKSGIVSARVINALLASLKVARLEVNTWSHNFRAELNVGERLVFSSKACTFDGRKGNLVLTDSRLVFVRKGKRTRGIALSSIQSLRSFNYHIFVPPGLPCLKVFIHDQPKPFIFSFALFSRRDLWNLNIMEMLAAAKMAASLRDRRILRQARHNVFLSQVLAKDKHKSLFHFFGRHFPRGGWFRFSTLLHTHGFLNTEVVQEQPVEKPMEELERLMRFIVELFFEFVNSDGESVDFASLRASPRWTAFNEDICKLQVFDLRALAVEARLVAYAQIYNMLVVHAFVLHGGFPSCLWDWRYLERTAYYTVGGVAYSIGDLHHGVLRGNRVAPWDEEVMFADSDPRRSYHADEAELRDPRMLFTLAMHNKMSPSMFTLRADQLELCLQRAADFFCQEHVSIRNSTITLPLLLHWYRADLGGSDEAVLRFVRDFLTPGKQKELTRLLATGDYELVWKEDWAPCPKPLFSVGC